MVIDNPDIVRVVFAPAEADAPLVIDADAVLASAFAFQSFQMVAPRHSQFAQLGRGMERQQFPPR